MRDSCHGRTVVCFLFAVAAILTGPSCVLALDLPSLEGAQPGPYAVGFKTVERYDSSRTYRTPYDYFGNKVNGEAQRPIQLCLWYPAKKEAGAVRMVYGEYVFPYPEDTRMFEHLSQVQEREITQLHVLLAGNSDLVMELLSTEMLAARDAPQADGVFPVVVYGGNAGRGVVENAFLFEFLASHGYVVASTHSVGTTGLLGNETPGNLETQARDLEFLIPIIGEFPAAGLDRLAVAGTGLGAQAALIVTMRNSRVRCAALLGDVPGDGNLGRHPHFAPEAARVPVQFFGLPEGPDGQELEAVRTLRHAERVVIRDERAPEPAVTCHDLIASSRPGMTAEHSGSVRLGYQLALTGMLRFLDVCFGADGPSEQRLRDLSPAHFLPGEPPPPTPEQLMQIVREYGASRAVEVCNRFNLPTEDKPMLPENTINLLGYRILGEGDPKLARDVLELGTRAYPRSANAWDSFAEACLANGEAQLALELSRKALEVLETDQTSSSQIKELLGNALPQRIRELEARSADAGRN